MTAYRPDIDGLRAIAVLSVVAGHAGITGFDGGYVGVDVFFVISGYLITSILAREIDGGRFSLWRFYERRARRILPALFAMCGFAVTAGYMLLMPADLAEFGRSLAAAALSLSNVFFWREIGYFAGPAEFKPLLHTWSLAVEEQFYIAYPVALYAATHFCSRRSLMMLGTGAFAVSFALSVYAVARYPGAAFYLAPFRAWELLLGGALALGIPSQSRSAQNVSGAVGLALIGAAVALFDAETPFPGWAALAPCTGAALLIYAGAGTSSVASRVLSARPLVFVGLISYSLYLWHWPLLAFARYFYARPLDAPETAVVVGVSIAVSALSWRFVERPFRDHDTVPTRSLVRYAAASTALALSAGAAIHAGDGFAARIPPEVQVLADGATDIDPRRDECRDRMDSAIAKACTIGDPSAGEATFALVGDSHADALMPAVDAAAARHRRKGLLLTKTSCRPTLGLWRFRAGHYDDSCLVPMEEVVAWIESLPAIDHVILAARWAIQLHGTGYASPVSFYLDALSSEQSLAENRRTFERGMGRFLERLRGRRVTVIASVPENSFWVPAAHAMAAKFGREPPRTAVRDFEARDQPVRDLLRNLSRSHEFDVVRPADVLCGEHCVSARNGRALYHDDDHLSLAGARELAGLFETVFADPTASVQP